MYLDPGFGSMIIQLAIAFIAGLGAYLAIIKKKVISAFFKRNKQAQQHQEL